MYDVLPTFGPQVQWKLQKQLPPWLKKVETNCPDIACTALNVFGLIGERAWPGDAGLYGQLEVKLHILLLLILVQAWPQIINIYFGF